MNFIDILRRHLNEFNQTYDSQLTTDMRQAINAMQRCRTELSGRSQWRCEHCQHQEQHPLSCGHRSCPRCQHTCCCDWLARQQAKLLPVDYFMVTFTLPAELRALAWHHPKRVYSAMFHVAAGILKDFGNSSPRLSANIGFTGVLHTHTRRREYHPHLHFVVPGGGYHPGKKQWQKNKGKYLFNAFALAKVWRARLLEKLIKVQGLPLNDTPAKWVVDCRHVGRGLPALQYLSRYLYRGVMPDRNIKSDSDGQISFEYRDSQSKTIKRRNLPAVKFLWLVLQHVLPKGFRRVRDYGFLRGNTSKLVQRIQLMLAQAGQLSLPVETADTTRQRAVRPCPCCQQAMHCIGILHYQLPVRPTGSS